MSFLRRDPRAALPTPGMLRRDRRSLLAAREERLRDLGGLIFEMFKRDQFNDVVVRERCEQLLDVERDLDEIARMLAAATHRAPLVQCACGGELPPLANFCPSCGRPRNDAPASAPAPEEA